MAWYQSDIKIGKQTDDGHVQIKTILLDDIFGFDPDVRLAPTNTFHLGFWFDNPAGCGGPAQLPLRPDQTHTIQWRTQGRTVCHAQYARRHYQIGPSLHRTHRSHKAVWLQTINDRFRGGEAQFIALLPFERRRHLEWIETIVRDPEFRSVCVDISWDDVAKYFVGTAEATKGLADLMQRYPDRFLFGTDSPAPSDQSKYLEVYDQYQPLWKSLDSETYQKVRLKNYERIFDEGRRRVRSWEKSHLSAARSMNR